MDACILKILNTTSTNVSKSFFISLIVYVGIIFGIGLVRRD